MFQSYQTNAIDEAANVGLNRKTYFSFGDEKGLTATVGASGRLLRISRHFSSMTTGFCVDDFDMPQPYLVDERLQALLDIANDPSRNEGIGLSLDLLPNGPEFKTKIDIVNDRWPKFRRTTEDGFQLELQYVAFDGKLYQRCKFTGVENDNSGAAHEPSPVFRINANLLIRNLDFVERENKFNKAKADEEAYKNAELREGNKCIIREHEDSGCNGKMKAVLRIDLLDKEGAEELVFVRSEGPSEYRVDREATTSRIKSMSFVLAYTLDYVNVRPGNITLPPADTLKTMDQLLDSRSQTQTFIDHPLQFFLRRNLEHVLSVCSIPVPSTRDGEPPAIALTCGDVEGHRVATAASFYATQILLRALEDLNCQHSLAPEACTNCQKPTSQRPYICETKRRIERVLEGHMRWLLLGIESPEDLFCPNRWVNGEKIARWETNRWLPPKSLTDAPFQIIKVAEFCKSPEGLHRFPELRKTLKCAIETWVQDLGKVNKLGMYAFPRYDDAEYHHTRTRHHRSQSFHSEFSGLKDQGETTQGFYLTDHALIWQAIAAAERMGVAQTLKDSEKRLYSSAHIRPRILKRFTTENPYSQGRTIAVTRSPTHNRFMLRSKDTLLFRAMEEGFFDQPGPRPNERTRNLVEVWEDTMECQVNHEDNDDTNWDDPRRFALSIIMARYHKPMNLRPPEEMREHAISVLLESSSANGLFPGKLNTDGERYEPDKYDNEQKRDNYWGATFEIPYVLWKYGFESKSTLEAGDVTNASPSKTKGEVLIANRLNSLSDSIGQVYTILKENPGKQTIPSEPQFTPGRPMKHIVPLTNAIDTRNIVEIQDEWLYKRPAFFQPGKDQSVTDSSKSDRQATMHQGLAFLLDVPRSRPMKKDDKETDVNLKSMSFTDISSTMAEDRTVNDAKKRFWAFFSAYPAANATCLDTVSEAEKRETGELQDFFEKHESYVKFFTEETAAAYNMWTTELHLSFYNVGSKAREGDLMPPTSSSIKDLTLPAVGRGGKRQPLARVVMSFRFEGDFFDRYWTCRYLEANEARAKLPAKHSSQSQKEKVTGGLWFRVPSWFRLHSREGSDTPRDDRVLVDERYESDAEEILKELLHEGEVGNSRITPWQQRRVLELLLFGRIVGEMTKQANLIIEEVVSRLSTHRPKTRSDGDASIILGKGLRPTRIQIEQIQDVLQRVEEDLSENVAEIDLWEKRETDRQAERPRWTLYDESRYRVVLQKLQNSNDRKVETLRRTRTKITNLKESLEKKLDHRRAEDIERFTYVTVIFLPLGFGTSIFSMSEVPEGHVVKWMAVVAVGALCTTVLLLVVARYLAKYASALTATASRVGLMFTWRNGKPKGDEETAGYS